MPSAPTRKPLYPKANESHSCPLGKGERVRVDGFLHVALAFLAICSQITLAGENLWTFQGPNGGLVYDFLFHPEQEVAYAVGGEALYRSTNGGRVWERLGIKPLGRGVAIHSKHGDTVIAIDVLGIFRSSDSGNTWQRISTLRFLASDMEFHSTDPDTLFLVEDITNGVWKTTDGGKTWAKKKTGLPNLVGEAAQLEVDPDNGDIVYLSLDRLAFKSTNGGESWQSISSGLAFSKPTNQLQALAINPINPQELYAGGDDGILKTTNGGHQWFSANCQCSIYDISLDPKHPQNVYGAGEDVVKSTDAGRTWKHLFVPQIIPDQYLYGIRVSPTNKKVILLGGYVGILRSVDDGTTWKSANKGLEDADVHELESPRQNLDPILAVGGPAYPFLLYLALNAGTEWLIVDKLTSFSVSDVEIHGENGNVIVAAIGPWAKYGPSLAVSTDGGKGWSLKRISEFSEADKVALDPKQKNIFYASEYGIGMMKSTDYGTTWIRRQSGITNTSITVLTTDPLDGSMLWVGTRRAGKIFKSTDSGKSWKDNTGSLQALDIHAIRVDPTNSDIVYVATDRGIYKTVDGGRKWTQKNKGLPRSAEFNFVALDPVRSQILFTGGNGLFISTDAADSWTAFDTNGLQRVIVNDLLIHPDPNKFFLATDHGVFSYSRAVTSGAPVIDQLSPPMAKKYQVIAIQGRNFGSAQGNSQVLFGDVTATGVQAWSDSKIALGVPAGAKTGPVMVTVASQRSNSFEFVLLPSAGSLEPVSGPSSGGTKVAILTPPTVTGTALFNVLFGSSLAKDIRFIPPNVILCTTPPGNGTVDVFITTSAVSSRVGTFSYQ